MKRAWRAAQIEALTLHEARHTAASLFIAAGMNAKTVSTFMGHANISITLDRYGHLFPGAEDEARVLLDDILDAWVATYSSMRLAYRGAARGSVGGT